MFARPRDLRKRRSQQRRHRDTLRNLVIVLWEGLIVLLPLCVVECVFDKEGPLVTSVHFFVHKGEMKINVYKVLLRRETNCNALNGFSLWSRDKRRKGMPTSVFSPLNQKASKDGCESKCYYWGDLSLFIPLS